MKSLSQAMSATLFVLLTLLHAASLRAGADPIPPFVVVMETTEGSISIELYPDKAPLSVASFLNAIDTDLFENGDGAFYRVVHSENDFVTPALNVIQGGITDYTQSLPLIAHETTRQTGLLHKNGTISLARGKGSSGSGSTFFICIGDQPTLDYGGSRYEDGQGFAAFGTVIQGMDIVRRILRKKTQQPLPDNVFIQQRLVEPVTIVRAYRQ